MANMDGGTAVSRCTQQSDLDTGKRLKFGSLKSSKIVRKNRPQMFKSS